MMNTYTHDEVRAIIRFVIEEERRQALQDELEAIANEPIQEEPKPEVKKAAPKKTAPKAKKKQPLDHGKIMALHRGNWSVAKIADEMGCSEQAVRNHIAQGTAQEGF